MSGIRLEPLGPEHATDVAGAFDDPESLRFTRLPEPPPDGFFESWLRSYEDGRRTGTRAGFAILGEDGGFLGVALAPSIDPAGREAELGYVVAAHARGRGVATEALRQLSAWAFSELGALRLELRISVDNEPSKRVAGRCGYRREGVLRSVHLKQDRREDCEVWSLLPGELV